MNTLNNITRQNAENRIHALAIQRIKYFEKRLREDYGIYVQCAAEIECFTTDASGNPVTVEIAPDSPLRVPNSRLLDLDLKGQKNNTGEYEMRSKISPIASHVRGGKGPLIHLSKRNSCLTTARLIDEVRHNAVRVQKDYGVDNVRFTSIFSHTDFSRRAGLHLNVSLWDKNGQPLFADAKSKTSTPLLYACANALLPVQHEGLALFAPTWMALERFSDIGTPRFIKAMQENSDYNQKENGPSLIVRNNTYDGKIFDPNQVRIENRIPGAEADPYLAVLATLGPLYTAAKQYESLTEAEKKEAVAEARNKTHLSTLSPHSEYLPHLIDRRNFIKEAERFKKSILMKDLLGDDLYQTLSSYVTEYKNMPHWDSEQQVSLVR